jgi:hypothetical protein
MSSNKTSTLSPAANGQSYFPLDDNDFASYLGLLRTNSAKKRQHDDDDETRSPKRRNKENIPPRNNAPVPEPVIQKQHMIDSDADKSPGPDIGKSSLGPGIGRKRANESDDEDDERRVKRRIAEDEEETSGGPPELASRRQEYDEEYIKTFGHKMTLPEACTERCTPNDADREMFRKSKEEAEKVGLYFCLSLFLDYLCIYIVQYNCGRRRRG